MFQLKDIIMGQNAIRNLVGNRDAIRRIMAMDANGSMDRIVETARSNGSLTFDGEGGSYSGSGKQGQLQDMGSVVVNEQVMQGHRHMPKAVLESFRQNPGKEASISVLGGLDISQFQKQQSQKNVVQEHMVQQQQAMTQVGGVDYSLLKTIINEAVQENVKKYMSALSKKLISEGVGGKGNEIQAIKIGKKLSIITENGDIYSSSLQKMGNVRDKMND